MNGTLVDMIIYPSQTLVVWFGVLTFVFFYASDIVMLARTRFCKVS